MLKVSVKSRVARASQKALVLMVMVPLWLLPEYRGSTRACRAIARLAAPTSFHSVLLRPSRERLRFAAGDHYWLRTISPLYAYERDVQNALAVAVNAGYSTFVDGGANIGYFTSAYSSEFHRIVSVEAAPITFMALEGNVASLANVTTHQQAIWSADNEWVSLVVDTNEHPSGHIDQTQENPGSGEQTVSTVTIDTLISGLDVVEIASVIIKLDVEGAEANALAGASQAIAGGATFILEEHGKDSECLTYQAVQKYLPDYRVAFLTHAGAIEVASMEELKALKRHSGVGYNIIAAAGQSHRGKLLLEGLVSGRRITVQERVWSIVQYLGWRLPSAVRRFLG